MSIVLFEISILSNNIRGAHHIFGGMRRLRHHRPPSSSLPANRSISKESLEMAINHLFIGRKLVAETGAHAVHLHRLTIGNLHHNIHVLYA
ncbi:hypothetical protein N7537_003757 [Penicillium hordei]|uniref:Uncharacterized protein n=1 Tax=Penicillium hordei TaxID=40994 RepID=A0AAD6H5M6_9EURO|nr:uncharacterized protein N7537_003757 [Penicillium hordei]KAJ5607138.1 hypothetical protein N7537_003757 [Penicillium hordei]